MGLRLTHVYGGVGSDQGVDRSCQANESGQTNGGPAGCDREVHPNICAWRPWRKHPDVAVSSGTSSSIPGVTNQSGIRIAKKPPT